MAELPDYEARATEADDFAEASHSAAAAQNWRKIAAEYRLLANSAGAESSEHEQDDPPLIGFSA